MTAHAQAHGHEAHAEHKHHVCSVALFTNVFIALMVLTTFTVFTAKYVDLGSFNMVLAMLIAGVKASLVMTFFMHLKWDTAMNQITILSSFLFLGLLFLFTLGDLSTRGSADLLHEKHAPMREDIDVRGYKSPLIKWSIEHKKSHPPGQGEGEKHK